MKELELLGLEANYPVRITQSAAEGLQYIEDDDNKGIGIAGVKGITGLTITQATALCWELPEMLRLKGYSHECIHS